VIVLEGFLKFLSTGCGGHYLLWLHHLKERKVSEKKVRKIDAAKKRKQTRGKNSRRKK
jgi:hypothetical protein